MSKLNENNEIKIYSLTSEKLLFIAEDEIEDLENVCTDFHLEKVNVLRYFSPTLCKVYKMETPSKRVVVKIYPDIYSEDEINSEMTFIQKLKDEAVPVPEYYLTQNGTLYAVLLNNRKAAVYTWIDGDHLDLTLTRAQLLINITIKLIGTAQDLPYQRNCDWMWDDFSRYWYEITIPDELKSWMSSNDSFSCPWKSNNRLQLCHNDISAKNVLWKNGINPIIIDFTNSITAPLEWEFATMTANVILEGSFIEDINSFKNLIQNSLSSSSINIDWPYFDQLLRLALSQRAVFKVRGANIETHEVIWRNLKNAILGLG